MLPEDPQLALQDIAQVLRLVQQEVHGDRAALPFGRAELLGLVGPADSGQTASCAVDNGHGTAATGSTHLPRSFSLPAGTPAPVVTAIAYAVAQLGKPYIWGGTGPDGFDCPGLIIMAYRAAGISLPRTTFQQVNVNIPVYALKQLQSSDLVFSAGSDGSAASPGHVGLAIGDGLIVEAPQQGEPVQVERTDGAYWGHQTTAIRRVVK